MLRYVREKHYDGTAMYRVVKGFVDQMGSFDAKGQGNVFAVLESPDPRQTDLEEYTRAVA